MVRSLVTPYLCLLVFTELPSFPNYFLNIYSVLCASLVFFVSSVLGLMFVSCFILESLASRIQCFLFCFLPVSSSLISLSCVPCLSAISSFPCVCVYILCVLPFVPCWIVCVTSVRHPWCLIRVSFSMFSCLSLLIHSYKVFVMFSMFPVFFSLAAPGLGFC